MADRSDFSRVEDLDRLTFPLDGTEDDILDVGRNFIVSIEKLEAL